MKWWASLDERAENVRNGREDDEGHPDDAAGRAPRPLATRTALAGGHRLDTGDRVPPPARGRPVEADQRHRRGLPAARGAIDPGRAPPGRRRARPGPAPER